MQTVTQKIVFTAFFCIGSVLLLQAQPTLNTTADKNQILIGEQVKVTVEASLPKEDFFIKWITLPDSMPHFELVDQSKIDSSFDDQKLTRLTQTFFFTSFDSGNFRLPAFNVTFTPSANDTTYSLFTDSLAISVAYQADSTNVLRDIKTIREVTDTIPLWYWLAGAAALLVLAAVAVWLYRRSKNGNNTARVRSSFTPYQQAILELEALTKNDLSSAPLIKQYHSKLPEIFKHYLSVTQGVNYGTSTTSEVLILLGQKGLGKNQLSTTAAALRCSDAVKFARFLPDNHESVACWQTIKQTIDLIERANTNKNETN
jgi:hypothetical protein